MITLKDFMECVDYRITEGSNFLWGCYGPNAQQFDYFNGRHDDAGCSVNIVFDTKDQTVYQMEAWDYGRDRQYRWINPDYLDAVTAEYTARDLDFSESLDDSKYIDLDDEGDILEKARAIVLGEEYDSRVVVSVEFSDDDFLAISKLAHEEDLTFNQMVEKVLRRVIDSYKVTHDDA